MVVTDPYYRSRRVRQLVLEGKSPEEAEALADQPSGIPEGAIMPSPLDRAMAEAFNRQSVQRGGGITRSNDVMNVPTGPDAIPGERTLGSGDPEIGYSGLGASIDLSDPTKYPQGAFPQAAAKGSELYPNAVPTAGTLGLLYPGLTGRDGQGTPEKLQEIMLSRLENEALAKGDNRLRGAGGAAGQMLPFPRTPPPSDWTESAEAQGKLSAPYLLARAAREAAMRRDPARAAELESFWAGRPGEDASPGDWSAYVGSQKYPEGIPMKGIPGRTMEEAQAGIGHYGRETARAAEAAEGLRRHGLTSTGVWVEKQDPVSEAVRQRLALKFGVEPKDLPTDPAALGSFRTAAQQATARQLLKARGIARANWPGMDPGLAMMMDQPGNNEMRDMALYGPGYVGQRNAIAGQQKIAETEAQGRVDAAKASREEQDPMLKSAALAKADAELEALYRAADPKANPMAHSWRKEAAKTKAKELRTVMPTGVRQDIEAALLAEGGDPDKAMEHFSRAFDPRHATENRITGGYSSAELGAIREEMDDIARAREWTKPAGGAVAPSPAPRIGNVNRAVREGQRQYSHGFPGGGVF